MSKGVKGTINEYLELSPNSDSNVGNVGIWNYFPEIWCINLEEREDRYNRSLSLFTSLGIKVNYLRVQKDKENPVRGCYNSHLKIIKESSKKKLERVLIFEDDVIVSDICNLEKYVRESVKFMEKENYEIFYLGCIPEIFQNRTQRIEGNIYKVNAFGGHAYVLSKRYIEKMKNVPYLGHAIDGIYSRCDKAYAHIPSIFIQGEFGTDIQGINLDMIKCDGVGLIEGYSTCVNVPLNNVILFLFLILILCLISCIFLGKRYGNIILVILLLVTFLFLIASSK